VSPEIKTEVPGEIVGEAEHEGHGRLIAVAAVVTTLLAAVTGFLQASALRAHDEADARAELLGTLSLNAASANKDLAQVQIERFQLLQQAQRSEANADAFNTYASQPTAAREAARWHTVAQNIEQDSRSIAQGQGLVATCPSSGEDQCFSKQTLPAICSPTAEPHSCGTAPGQGGWYSPEEDPNFPTRYQEAAQRESYFLSARRDAANEQADAAESQFVHLAAALTMFAVAVFLFGYSLTPQGRRRRWLFSGVASGFAVVGAVWAMFHVVGGTPMPPQAAASAYADGEVALNDNDYVSADQDLSRAVKLRPKFVDAWSDLALAKYSEGTPQPYVNNEQTQIAGVPALKAALHADQEAIDNGSESPNVRFDLGSNLLYLGLLTHNDDLVRQSRGVSVDADKRFADQLRSGRHPGSFLLYSDFDTAEADLVDGSGLAGGEYRAAEQRMLRLRAELSVESVVADALTDLNLIAQTRPRLAGRAGAIEDQILGVASRSDYENWFTTPGGYSQSGNDVAQLSGVQIQPDPSHMQFTISGATNFRPNNDLMSVQWEYKDPVNGNWEVLPDISGPVAPGNLNSLTSQGNNAYISNNPSFISQSSPHTCLPPGQYRAAIYVNGRLAGQSPPTSSTWGPAQGTGFRGIDAAFCKPSGWQGVTVGSNTDLFTSSDGTSGAAILTIPQSALGNGSIADLMRQVVSGFAGVSGSPAHGAKPIQGDRSSYFMNFPDARQQLWGYTVGSKVGVLFSAVGASQDHELYVGLVYGSDTQANTDRLVTRLGNLLLSFSPV